MYDHKTTAAFVLARYAHGESSRVYKLFTREHGMVYVHGQSVRELKSRNRYGLVTHGESTVSLVRGRGSWRLTGAHVHVRNAPLPWRRTLHLAGRLLPQEDPMPELFDTLVRLRVLAEQCDEVHRTAYEAIAALHVLHVLGYVKRPRTSLADSVLVQGVCAVSEIKAWMPHTRELVRMVNETLHELPLR